VPYRITDKGPSVLRPKEDREIWRDTGPLALLNARTYLSSDAKVKFARPRLLDQFEDLFRYERAALSLTVYGMRTDMKMKVFEWYREILAVPAQLVIGSKFALFAQDCIDEAGSAEYALRRSMKHLARDDGKANPRALDTLIANGTRRYWSGLRTDYFEMLDALALLPEDERAEARFAIQDRWRDSVRHVAEDVFDEASRDMDTYGDNIQRQVEAERSLQMALKRLFESPEEKDARMAKATSTKGGYKQ